MNKHYAHEEVIGVPGTRIRSKTTLMAGDPLQSKVKVVCARCNSSWLSALQGRAKLHLIPLVKGNTKVLGQDAQQAIAAWCAMATMTGEFLSHDQTSVAISQSERDFFRDNLRPPNNWKIWIGHFVRHKWPGRWIHFSVPILDSRTYTENLEERIAPPNTQTTTFVVGKLLVHAISTSADPAIVSKWIWPTTTRPGNLLVQIFPMKESIIVWPPPSLSDNDAQHISTAFNQVIDAASRDAFGFRLF